MGGKRAAAGVSRLVWWANVCLLAASEPVNHYGLRKRLRPTFLLLHSPFSSFKPPPIVRLTLPLSLFPRARLASPSNHPLVLPRVHLCLSFSLAFSPARSSPSFPSVASSPRCSVLQARYNAARRRPSCIFKRAVLPCSHPHHLRRPLDDRSPPSPTPAPTSTSLCRVRFVRRFCTTSIKNRPTRFDVFF